jgi:hypothetical protein
MTGLRSHEHLCVCLNNVSVGLVDTKVKSTDITTVPKEKGPLSIHKLMLPGSDCGFLGNKKGLPYMASLFLYGALGRIRTFDRSVRSRVLYPAELRVLKGG